MQTDPRNIAVPDGFVNMIPTDIRGLTFARTPQMVRGRQSLGPTEPLQLPLPGRGGGPGPFRGLNSPLVDYHG